MPKAFTRNLEGSIGFRLFNILSMTPGGDIVPFYFEPTLGGADINGNESLSSYQDYRFRASNVLLLRENFEHSIGKWPIGIALSADEGKLSMTRGALGSAPLGTQLCRRPDAACGRFSPSLSIVCLWRTRRDAYHSERKYFTFRGIWEALIVLRVADVHLRI